MKMIILAAITVIGLGMTLVNAPAYSLTSSPQQGDQSNFMRGGGG